ncbi:MAG TPA: threonine/serine dehydratase [Gemmatimonadales bacterium]|nr:threonine/serine dehydratase [Gemmatimonadales bacterium]HRX17810.1 threonine/serine dehydratase [Gemmatimonadales bacterium]
MTARPDAASLEAARAGLAGIAERTPLLDVPGYPHPVRLKAEHLQPIAAFKIRGAWTAISRLDPAERARGIVTSSSGNHGYAVAWAAHRLGVPAVVVMPENTAQVKQDNVRSVGGEVRLVGATRGPEQQAAADEIAARDGLVMIPPYDHPDVIAGQATCAMEILEEWPDVTTLVVGCGGGGLLAGTCLAVEASGRDIRVVGVEPEQVPKLSMARAAGHPADVSGGTSLADGMLTRSVGQLTWPIIAPVLDEVIGVSDDDLRAAMRALADLGVRAEPSGAAPMAALVSGRLVLDGPTAMIVSGGNVDPSRYARLVA